MSPTADGNGLSLRSRRDGVCKGAFYPEYKDRGEPVELRGNPYCDYYDAGTVQVAGQLIAGEGNGSIHHQQQAPAKRSELTSAREKFMASSEGAGAAEVKAHREAEYERVWAARAEPEAAVDEEEIQEASKAESRKDDTPPLSAATSSLEPTSSAKLTSRQQIAALLEEVYTVVSEAVGNRFISPSGSPVEQVRELPNPNTPPAAVATMNS